MDLHHGKIREELQHKHKWGGWFDRWCWVFVFLLLKRVHTSATKAVVSPRFMNGKKGFVISSPYLVMALYNGNVLFMRLRIKRGTEARGGVWGGSCSPTSK